MSDGYLIGPNLATQLCRLLAKGEPRHVKTAPLYQRPTPQILSQRVTYPFKNMSNESCPPYGLLELYGWLADVETPVALCRRPTSFGGTLNANLTGHTFMANTGAWVKSGSIGKARMGPGTRVYGSASAYGFMAPLANQWHGGSNDYLAGWRVMGTTDDPDHLSVDLRGIPSAGALYGGSASGVGLVGDAITGYTSGSAIGIDVTQGDDLFHIYWRGVFLVRFSAVMEIAAATECTLFLYVNGVAGGDLAVASSHADYAHTIPASGAYTGLFDTDDEIGLGAIRSAGGGNIDVTEASLMLERLEP